ncbi:uncharacterized protein [Anabrus simplex]|uniref:uncharacterized protein isoform X2 n=1 Tax=Anabrus simplex TaxID=316456 RepID=UPI0034DCF4A2
MRLVSASPVKVLYSSHHHHPQSVLPECISSEANLEYLIFVSCPGCHRLWMASIPQGAYAAWKVHRNMMKDLSEDCPIMGKKNDSEKSIPSQYHFPQRNKILLDHHPAKYNSKMMNSIWGLYNRYSVHNLKKITDGDEELGLGVQQQMTSHW